MAIDGTARRVAVRSNQLAVVELIDAHVRGQLRSHFADLCLALHAADLPVLVLVECFGWSACERWSHAGEQVELPRDALWRIAKHIRTSPARQTTV